MLNRVKQLLRDRNNRMIRIRRFLSDRGSNGKGINRRFDNLVRGLAVFFGVKFLFIVKLIFEFHSFVGLLIGGGRCIEGVLKFIVGNLGG